MSEPTAIIENYHRAYEALNGRREYKINYERGWYAFRAAGGYPLFKKRRADVERMIATLEFRKRQATKKEAEPSALTEGERT